MNCDYYIHHDIVIEYYSTDESIKKCRINIMIERGYIGFIDDESDDNIKVEQEYKKQLKLRIDINTYENIFYENGEWTINRYEEKYKDRINDILPDLDNGRYIKIYKDVYAYKR
jgi:hypothetical protein